MSYMKNLGTSAKGNDRLLKQYGGNAGSSPMARQHYAKGGAVKGGNPSLDEGLSASGSPAKPSLARPGRKAPKKGDGKKGTSVNVIIAQAPKPDMGGLPPMAGAGPMPMPPPGPGGPPMPMRKSGGKVKAFKKGGRVKHKADGGWTGEGDSGKKLREKAKDVRDEPNLLKGNLGSLAATAVGQLDLMRKRGPSGLGLATTAGGLSYLGKKIYDSATAKSRAKKLEKEADEAEGKKRGGRACKREGGPAISGFNAGAGGARGRLEKMKKYGK